MANHMAFGAHQRKGYAVQRLVPPSPSCPPLRGWSQTSGAARRLRAVRPLPQGSLDLDFLGVEGGALQLQVGLQPPATRVMSIIN